MQVKERKQAPNNENRGFNSALYLIKKLEIDTRDYKVEKKRRFGKEVTPKNGFSMHTPKSIDTPQSCTSVIDLKNCISNDLLKKLEESSPTKSRNSFEEICEVIGQNQENLDESSDNIIINLKPASDSAYVEDNQEFLIQQPKMNLPNTHSFFYKPNQNFTFNQYNNLPIPNAFPINNIPMASMFYFKNNSEGNLLNANNQRSKINNDNNDFSKLFKINDDIVVKQEETVSNKITKENSDNKNIIKKTINNQDIKGWTCTQCKNFNYESKLFLNSFYSESKM